MCYVRAHSSLSGKHFLGRLTGQVQDPSAKQTAYKQTNLVHKSDMDFKRICIFYIIQTKVIFRPNGLKLTSADVWCWRWNTDPLTFLCCQHSCLQFILSILSFSAFTDTHSRISTQTHTQAHLCCSSFSASQCGKTLHPEASRIINSLDASMLSSRATSLSSFHSRLINTFLRFFFTDSCQVRSTPTPRTSLWNMDQKIKSRNESNFKREFISLDYLWIPGSI